MLNVECLDVPFALSISSEWLKEFHAGCALDSQILTPVMVMHTNASASLAHANEPADFLKAACGR